MADFFTARKMIGLFVLLFVLYWIWFFLPLGQWSIAVSEFAKDNGRQGMIFFGVIYVIATVFLFPCAFLTFAAGVAYGFSAFPLITVSAVIGASLAFLVSKHFVKSQVEKVMAGRPTTRAIKSAIEKEGWKFMLLLRVSPIIPFNLNNYFLGTVQVRFLTYIWVTLVGSVPGTFLYLYLGAVGKDINERSQWHWLILIFGLLATFLLIRLTHKKTKEILNKSHGLF
jgi:uncharacterized membrane protein YdjX (TVP38/TMEM64 family)